ncbi:MAG: (4Fe-4S)-binding protein [Desulfarculus sp.]|nr:(4Fe-4S)-binding protein [Desulfarculus sp.]
MAKILKKIKTVTIKADLCNGCRACEIACSAFHASPPYSSINPARSRIRIIRYPLDDIWMPVFAGEYTPAECMGRDKYVIDGKEYEECAFCRAVCPSREVFKEPDSGLPLKCDMCEGEDIPLCVLKCLNNVLILEEREEEVKQQPSHEGLEVSVDALLDKYGYSKLYDAVARKAVRE